MAEPPRWRRLQERAHAFLDANPDLVLAARRCRGFGRGGEWMGSVLSRHRSAEALPPRPGASPRRRRAPIFLARRRLAPRDETRSQLAAACWRKYALCTLGAVAMGSLSGLLAPWTAPIAAILTFYAVEARGVFLVPTILDHGRRSRRVRGALLRRAGGVPTILCVVMPIAATMIFGAFCRRGPLRAWLAGCVAIVLWYRDLKDLHQTAGPVIELGARCRLAVRSIRLPSDRTRRTRLLYASDLHLGSRASVSSARDILRIAARERPEAVLLGGDLVDGRRGLNELGRFVARLARLAPVSAVPGNHDHWAGIDQVRDAVRGAGGHWLPDGPLRLGDLQVDGTPTTSSGPSLYRVLCAHDPTTFDAALESDYDLVLAGHLHGGQCLLFRHRGRDYPGAWFYPWNGLAFQVGRTRMFVSRGCADTLPVRVRCPRELLMCDIGEAGGGRREVPSRPARSLGSPR